MRVSLIFFNISFISWRDIPQKTFSLLGGDVTIFYLLTRIPKKTHLFCMVEWERVYIVCKTFEIDEVEGNKVSFVAPARHRRVYSDNTWCSRAKVSSTTEIGSNFLSVKRGNIVEHRYTITEWTNGISLQDFRFQMLKSSIICKSKIRYKPLMQISKC